MAVVNPPFATSDDVAGVWRAIRTDEIGLVDNLLDDASAMVLEYPAVVTRIAAGTLSAATLKDVVKHMVKRVMLNPTGLRQFSATVDDATKSGTYDSGIATGQLTITGLELDRLLGIVPADSQAGAFTIRPYYELDELVTPPWT